MMGEVVSFFADFFLRYYYYHIHIQIIMSTDPETVTDTSSDDDQLEFTDAFVGGDDKPSSSKTLRKTIRDYEWRDPVCKPSDMGLVANKGVITIESIRERSPAYKVIVDAFDPDWNVHCRYWRDFQYYSPKSIFRYYCRVWYVDQYGVILNDQHLEEAFPDLKPDKERGKRCCVFGKQCRHCNGYNIQTSRRR